MNDRLEERVAIVVMEDPYFSGTMLERVSAVVDEGAATRRLHRAARLEAVAG